LLTRLAAPEPARLLQELSAELPDGASLSGGDRRAAIAELNQRISEVSFQLGLAPALFTALIRISLASGTGLALVLGLLDTAGGEPWQRASRVGMCALAGFVGALALANLGRMAKARVTRIREDWDRVSREAGKSLGTSLEGARESAGARAPSARLKAQ
jgi:heme A synthase